MSILLDSSAWLAHLFDEPGVEEIGSFFEDAGTPVSISALSIPEVYARLKAIGREDKWDEVWGIYSELFNSVIAADEAVALQAIKLRSSSKVRLPAIDSLIAATAVLGGLTLVHRDPHMAEIKRGGLKHHRLPEK